MLGFAAGLGLCFVGVDPASATAPAPLRGNILGAVAGVTWALTILGLRRLGREEETGGGGSAASAALVGNVLAFAAALPLALPFAGPELGARDLGVILYLGAFQVGLAYVALTRGIRRVPALEASLLLLLEPVISPIWAWLIHGERPGIWCLSGGALILAVTLTKTWHDSHSARRLRERTGGTP
jgi:drug/metabolite transporter (DMT)-like permease